MPSWKTASSSATVVMSTAAAPRGGDGSDFDDVAVDDDVVPRLAVGVPQHPEIPHEACQSRKQAGEVAADATPPADRAAGELVHHPDPQQPLADRLARRPAF